MKIYSRSRMNWRKTRVSRLSVLFQSFWLLTTQKIVSQLELLTKNPFQAKNWLILNLLLQPLVRWNVFFPSTKRCWTPIGRVLSFTTWGKYLLHGATLN
jgi:hypothetical protein